MNKEESTVNEFDENTVEDNAESDESSVPLSQFEKIKDDYLRLCLLYTSPSPRDRTRSRMPSSA